MVWYVIEIRAKARAEDKTQADNIENTIKQCLKNNNFSGLIRLVRHDTVEIENKTHETTCEIHVTEV